APIPSRTQMGQRSTVRSALAEPAAPEPTPLERTQQRMESALDDVIVSAPRIKDHGIPLRTEQGKRAKRPPSDDPSWSEVFGEMLPQIGARIESKIAGVKEYRGEERERQAKKRFWQAEVLPGAVQRALEAK